jgi:hypothetical protein
MLDMEERETNEGRTLLRRVFRLHKRRPENWEKPGFA